jgi:AP-1 complex subunit sigma 1/2
VQLRGAFLRSSLKDARTLFTVRFGLCALTRAVQEWGQYKLVYRRYASLYFCVGVDPGDNELLMLDTIHTYVETLDKYFGNVCELDLIFNFHKAYYCLDEVFIAGELQETSKKVILREIAAGDSLADQDMPESDR